MTEKLEQIAELIRSNRLEEANGALQAAAPPEGDGPTEYLFLQGYLAERGHDWDRCIDLYEQVLAIDGEHSEALFRLAYTCDLLGDDDRVLELYEKCTSESPVHVNALMNMAVAYEDRGKYDEAVECVECVLDQYPNHTRARLFAKDMEAARTMYYDENQERMRERRDAVLDTPVSDFELSVRSRNCLKQMNIRTLGDLLSTSEQELLAYKNFGETSLNEIRAMLAQTGLNLNPQQQEEAKEGGLLAATPPRAAITGDPVVLQRPVGEMELSVRSRKCLQRLGITTVGELAGCTEAELLAIKNFGQTSLVEIKRRLVDLGLSLRGQN